VAISSSVMTSQLTARATMMRHSDATKVVSPMYSIIETPVNA